MAWGNPVLAANPWSHSVSLTRSSVSGSRLYVHGGDDIGRPGVVEVPVEQVASTFEARSSASPK